MNHTYFNAQKLKHLGGKSWQNDDKNDDKDGDMTFWKFYMAYTFDCLLINLLNSCLFVY